MKLQERPGMNHIMTSLRLTGITLLLCSVAYPLFILIAGQIGMPYTANGSLLTDSEGRVLGSELIAQPFSSPGYLWPRPSAVDYNGAGAGGSNLSPTNPALRERAAGALKAYGANKGVPVPLDLVTASGSGLDPHITLKSALFQVDRIAGARGFPDGAINKVLLDNSFVPGGVFAREPLVNVLKVNLALDELEQKGM